VPDVVGELLEADAGVLLHLGEDLVPLRAALADLHHLHERDRHDARDRQHDHGLDEGKTAPPPGERPRAGPGGDRPVPAGAVLLPFDA